MREAALGDRERADIAGLKRRAAWVRAWALIWPAAVLLDHVATLRLLEALEPLFNDSARLDPDDPFAWPLAVAEEALWNWLLVLSVVVIVANCLWIARAAAIARRVRPDIMTISPAWAVAWSFVPIAWWWMPYRVLRQARGAALGPAAPGLALYAIWWSFVLASSFSGVALIAWELWRPGETFELWSFGGVAGLWLASDAFSFAACFLFRPIVAEISAGLAARTTEKAFD